MQKTSTYDTNIPAQASGGIKLKASEPLSPNAFVRIPSEVQPASQTSTSIPLPRQKKMRVPRGGSVERPAQRNPRNQPAAPERAQSVQDPVGPSLRIVLEHDEDDAPQDADDQGQAESLAQFVSNFPKIPSGLIFEFPENEANESALEDDPSIEDDAKTIRLDEGQMPPDGRTQAIPFQRSSAPSRRSHSQDLPLWNAHSRDLPPRNVHSQDLPPRASSQGEGSRIQPVNPRFEKLIREATSQPIPYGSGSRATSPHPASFKLSRTPSPVDKPRFNWNNAQAQRRPLRPNAPFASSAPIRQQGMASAASGPLPRQNAASGPLKPTAPSPALAARIPAVSSPFAPAPAPARNSASLSTAAAPSAPAPEPLLDASAIEESTMFDEPPISIAEGMKDADKSHKKGRTAIIVVLVAIIVALVAFMAFMSSRGSITIPEISITTKDINGNAANGSSASSNSSGPTQESISGADEPVASGAGAVTYRYTAKTPAGIEYSVEESTTFDDAGHCTFTTMMMQFPNERAAKDFTDNLARDLGSKFTLDALNGANATVTVDNSALGLDREDYENALRFSVDDLVILKK